LDQNFRIDIDLLLTAHFAKEIVMSLSAITINLLSAWITVTDYYYRR